LAHVNKVALCILLKEESEGGREGGKRKKEIKKEERTFSSAMPFMSVCP
jgi:hypothetical protein